MRTTLLAVTLVGTSALAQDTEALARDAIADLQARAFERVTKRFDTNMTNALTATKLGQVWDGAIAQFGAVKSIRSVTIEKKDPMQVAQVLTAFEKTDVLITIAFDPKQKIGGLFMKPIFAWTNPSYASASTIEREVTVGAKKLPGTLTLPAGAGPFRAVIFVHGSGPNDRDETVGPNKLFKDLSLGLAAKGIATLRYEKRTRFVPAEFPVTSQYTVKEEVLDDVREAVSLLASTKEVDSRHIVVLGHSLGGLLAPRIARDDARVAGIAIFAGPTRPIEVLVREQVRVTAPGNAELAANVEAFAKQLNDPKLAAGDVVDFLGAKLPGSYFLDLRAYDAAKAIAPVKQPVFVAQGDRDYQVTLADFEGWKRAKPTATLKRYAALNHHFLEGTGPSTPAEYLKPGHVPAVVIDDLATWIGSLK